jgi:hypothetical protein
MIGDIDDSSFPAATVSTIHTCAATDHHIEDFIDQISSSANLNVGGFQRKNWKEMKTITF